MKVKALSVVISLILTTPLCANAQTDISAIEVAASILYSTSPYNLRSPQFVLVEKKPVPSLLFVLVKMVIMPVFVLSLWLT